MATTPFPVGDHTCAPPKSMAALSRSSKFMLKMPWFSSSLQLRPFSASSPILSHQNQIPIKPISPPRTAVRVRNKVKADLKDNWLASLSSPLPPHFANLHAQDQEEGPDPNNAGSDWVIGIDPDISGAMAVLKGDDSECPAQVFDSPHLPLLVGGKVRRRLDAKSIIQLLRSFDAPIGTTAYIEQSIPFPKDGKQGWWSGGFGYGLWIGILVTLGFSVVPVPSFSWKKKFELSGSTFTKDDSRRVASTLFPSLSLQLKRKKDHGRAEALLIAAYGRGLKMELDSSFTLEELVS